ncbi:MAG: hypothetical protein M1127_01595 [Patescibacteria group bacterium]|nr:hypothetical protein [Patescibacteria group bacterium]
MEKIFVLPVLFLAVFLIAIFLVWPAAENFFALQKLNLQKQKNFQAQQDYSDKLKDASGRAVFFGDELAKINSALPRGLAAASLMEFLQAKSSENGLSVEALKPPGIVYKKTAGGATSTTGQADPEQGAPQTEDAATAASQVREAEFILSGRGSIESFENFLRALETSTRLFEIETFSLAGNLSSGLLPDFNLLLKVYYY